MSRAFKLFVLFAWVAATLTLAASCSKEQSAAVRPAAPGAADASPDELRDAPDDGTGLAQEPDLFTEMDELPGESYGEPARSPDVHFVPTPQEVVDRMLELANVTEDDLVYDLGCGDGRIVVTAAKKYGCRAVGVDIDPQRVAESLENVRDNSVEDLVEIKEGDIFELDLTPASVITLYLLPELNRKLIPQLEKLKPGTRIVSHAFDMRGVKPDTIETVEAERGTSHTVYLWTTPLQKEDDAGDDLGMDALPDVSDEPSPFDLPADLFAEMDETPGESYREPSRRPDVHFVPTPQEVVDRMLELANVTKDDVVYDLGCGDGRIVVTAAKKYGCEAVGVDIDPQRVAESLKNVKDNSVEDLVEIKEGDIFELDLTPASVITLYLLPDLNVRLIPQLEKLKPGTRIVSHAFDMRGVKPDKIETVEIEGGGSYTVYLWTTPLQKEDDADLGLDEMAGFDDAPGPFDRPADLFAETDETVGGSDREPSRRPDVHFVPTPQEVVDRMLELAGVTKDDVVYDLGCGDGRIVVTAAKKYGCKAIGVDIDPQRVEESVKNVKDNKLEDLVEIKEADIFELDLTPASVITLYLLPGLNRKLIPQLEKLKPGTRIVSHAFDMRGVKPDKVETVEAERGTSHTVYLWTTPLQKEDDAGVDEMF